MIGKFVVIGEIMEKKEFLGKKEFTILILNTETGEIIKKEV